MRIYEFYNGSSFSFQAKGNYMADEFIKKVREQFDLGIRGKHLSDVQQIYKKWGYIKAEESGYMGYTKCSQHEKDAEVFTKVVLI